MACDRFTDALRSRALGAPLRADAAAHLAICPHCQATLESEERVLAAIGRALHDVGTVKPAPEFVSRVRARVEEAPRWNPGAWWKPAAAAAAAVLIAAIVGGRARQDRPAVSVQTKPVPVQRGDDARVDVDKAAVGRIDRRPSASANRTRSGHPRTARAERAAQSPEVLVPPDQRRAVHRLFDSLRAGRPDVVSALMRLDGGASVIEPDGLTIAPIHIEPVVVSTLPVAAPIDK
jgi:hypothetical protein